MNSLTIPLSYQRSHLKSHFPTPPVYFRIYFQPSKITHNRGFLYPLLRRGLILGPKIYHISFLQFSSSLGTNLQQKTVLNNMFLLLAIFLFKVHAKTSASSARKITCKVYIYSQILHKTPIFLFRTK